jgi:hypothetical protein
MKEWRLIRFQPISVTSNISDNSGQYPLQPKYFKTYLNLDTAEIKHSNDLIQKKNRRNFIFNEFCRKYSSLYKKKYISVFAIVVSEFEFPSMSKFINSFSRKLKRKGVEKLGYAWMRDIGEVKFEKHYHLLMATSKVNHKLFVELFSKKRNNKYDIQFVKNMKGIVGYIKDKNLFARNKQRAFGKSKEFLLPN